MKPERQNLNSVFISILAIGVSFLLGMGVGYDSRPEIEKVFTLKNKEPVVSVQTDFTPFWTTWNLINQKYVNGETFEEIGTTTTTSTVVKKMPSDEDKLWGAISGLVGSLGDPYSIFMPPERAKSFQSEISGTFEGVGMELGIKEGVITVVAPLEGTPAKRAGIRPGDRIVGVEGKSSFGMSVEEAVGDRKSVV